MQTPQFGKKPSGARLERIKQSPHYANGRFNNLVPKPTITPGYSMSKEIYNSLFKKYPRTAPTDSLPSVKTDLKALPLDSNVLVWFGHSSVYLQVNGKRILVDPAFSGKASPLPWGIKAFKGSNVYQPEDFPTIDYLLISHDHYDHLDYETIKALQSKVKQVVCGLGVGEHFEYWGYEPKQIIEKDWDEEVAIAHDITLHTLSTHHESGRGFSRGTSLWLSFLLETPTQKIYISGDGGYDGRFKQIGEKFGPIDWVILENGQYNKAWQSVHNLPEEVAQATLDLKTKQLITVHHSKFTLARHPWDEPLNLIAQHAKSHNYKLATPMIGEVVDLHSNTQVFKEWWRGIN